MRYSSTVLVCAALLGGAVPGHAAPLRPFFFEPNRGQAPGAAAYLARGSGYHLAFQPGSMDLSLRHGPGSATLKMELAGADPGATLTAGEPLPARVSYFVGDNPKRWRRDIPTCGRLRARGVYPGVDLVYYGTDGALEYDFELAPHADPARIRLRFSGADGARVAADGALELSVGGRNVRWKRPVAYQVEGGRRVPVAAAYVLRGAREATFRLGAYDHAKPLVIDPVLDFSTYFGSDWGESGAAVATDAAGNAYVTGQFWSQANSQDIYVLKLSPGGKMLQGVYFGGKTGVNGDGGDYASGIAVDGAGNILVTGYTSAVDYPLVNPFYSSLGEDYTAVVTKVPPTMDSLLYSSYAGGSGNSYGDDIAVDPQGNAVMVRSHYIGTAYANVWVTRISPTGAKLWEKSMSGSGMTFGGGVAADSAGNAWVAGETWAGDMTVVNPIQKDNAGGFGDIFIARMSAADGSLLYSTYYGGAAGEDSATDVALDPAGNVYVTGRTTSTDFPLKNAMQPTYGGGSLGDAIALKLSPDGGKVLYSTFLGGEDWDEAARISPDAAGNAYIVGRTRSTHFPTKDPTQAAHAKDADANGQTGFDGFVTRLDPNGALLFSTYFGGSANDNLDGVAADANGGAWFVGSTTSTDLKQVNPLQNAFGGGTQTDAVFAHIAQGGGAPPLAGDANGDNKVDADDVRATLKTLAGLAPIQNFAAADVNKDGVVDLRDAVSIMRFVAGTQPAP